MFWNIQSFNKSIVLLFLSLFCFSAAAEPAVRSEPQYSKTERGNSIPGELHICFATTRLNEGSITKPSYGCRRHLDLGGGSLDFGTAVMKSPPQMMRPNQARSGIEFVDRFTEDSRLWHQTPVSSISSLQEDELKIKLRQCTGKICVYIHGYDKTFEGALQDASMLFADYSQYTDDTHQLLPLLFSWPSAASTGKYSYDESNIEWSRDAFENFMDLVMKEKNPEATVDIVAHSLGSRLAVSYLTQERPGIPLPCLGNLFLCSGDIDFHSVESARISLEKAVKGLVYIFVSDNDRPLIMSQLLHGEPRLGRPVDPPGEDEDQRRGSGKRDKSADLWTKLASSAIEIWLGPSCTDGQDVLAWLSANPFLDREFGERSRLIDVSELSVVNMGHGIVWPVISSIMAGKEELPFLKGRPVHKRPDRDYLIQCGGKPRVLYRYTRLEPN